MTALRWKNEIVPGMDAASTFVPAFWFRRTVTIEH